MRSQLGVRVKTLPEEARSRRRQRLCRRMLSDSWQVDMREDASRGRCFASSAFFHLLLLRVFI